MRVMNHHELFDLCPCFDRPFRRSSLLKEFWFCSVHSFRPLQLKPYAGVKHTFVLETSAGVGTSREGNGLDSKKGKEGHHQSQKHMSSAQKERPQDSPQMVSPRIRFCDNGYRPFFRTISVKISLVWLFELLLRIRPFFNCNFISCAASIMTKTSIIARSRTGLSCC